MFCHLKAALFVFVIVLAACTHSTEPAINTSALSREFSVQTSDGLAIAPRSAVLPGNLPSSSSTDWGSVA